MTTQGFDATIILGGHHLAATSLTGRADEAVAAVREAVGRMAGAGWIDVVAQSYPPTLPGWVIVYPPGRCMTPDTLAWQVEEIAMSALVAIGAPS